MTNRPKQIGTRTETAVVRYVQPRGFPHAERLALHGALDEADVQLCPGLVVEIKGGKAAETASDLVVARWLRETEAERANRGADVAFLVCKRAGKGDANAGAWWAWLPGWTFHYLAECVLDDFNATRTASAFRASLSNLPAVRMTLAEAVALLRWAGYGSPLVPEGDTAA